MYIFLILFFLTISFGSTESYQQTKDALNSKNYELALNTILELIKNNLNNDEFYYLASEIYYAIGDLDNSNANILNAIEIENDNKAYRKYQKKLEKLKSATKSAQKTFDNGYIDESIAEYNLLIQEFPNSPISHYSLGLIYLKTNNYKLAVQNFNQAIEINPYKSEKYNKSIISISQRLAKSGDDKFRIKEFNEALALYLESVAYYPEFVAVLYRITNVYQQMNDYENAKIYAEKILIYDDNHYKVMKTLGDLYYKLEDIEGSLKFYNKSITTNSNYYKAYYSLAKVLNEQGDSAEAIAGLDKAISINPHYDKAYILLGVIYSDNSDYVKAIYNFNKAIDIKDNNYKLYGRLAETYNKSEKYSKAKVSAKESLKIKHNYAGAFFELGYAELSMCNKVASIDAFEKAKKNKTYRKSAKHYLDNMNQIFAKNCK